MNTNQGKRNKKTSGKHKSAVLVQPLTPVASESASAPNRIISPLTHEFWDAPAAPLEEKLSLLENFVPITEEEQRRWFDTPYTDENQKMIDREAFDRIQWKSSGV